MCVELVNKEKKNRVKKKKKKKIDRDDLDLCRSLESYVDYASFCYNFAVHFSFYLQLFQRVVFFFPSPFWLYFLNK